MFVECREQMSNQSTGESVADEEENYTTIDATATIGTADTGHHSYQQLEPYISYLEPQPQDVMPWCYIIIDSSQFIKLRFIAATLIQ